MKGLLAALLLVPGLTFAQSASVSPQRQAEIEALLPQWEQVKDQADRTVEDFLRAIKSDPSSFDYSEWQPPIARAWALCESIEADERGRQDALMDDLDGLMRRGEISEAERARQVAVLTKIFQLRMIGVYGDMMPRVLDESLLENGQPAGRRYAGPSWKIWLSQDEMHALDRAYEDQSVLPREKFTSKIY